MRGVVACQSLLREEASSGHTFSACTLMRRLSVVGKAFFLAHRLLFTFSKKKHVFSDSKRDHGL